MLAVSGALDGPGAMRRIAALIDERVPDVCALHGIDPGDALGLATRFDRTWVYRGGEALLWTGGFTVQAVRERYLPVSALRPFERAGLLYVDGVAGETPLAFVVTRCSDNRAVRAAELRFIRAQLRDAAASVVAIAGPCAAVPPLRGAAELARDGAGTIWARGLTGLVATVATI